MGGQSGKMSWRHANKPVFGSDWSSMTRSMCVHLADNRNNISESWQWSIHWAASIRYVNSFRIPPLEHHGRREVDVRDVKNLAVDSVDLAQPVLQVTGRHLIIAGTHHGPGENGLSRIRRRRCRCAAGETNHSPTPF